MVVGSFVRMPNTTHDLTPHFKDEINAEIVDFNVYTVGEGGYAEVDKKYAHHLVAWAPLKDGGQLKTTSYNQNKKERTQTYVQKEGGVNIGTEEWIGERIVLLVLDRTLDK